jgi:two-component system chemotaxis response regulator CheY
MSGPVALVIEDSPTMRQLIGVALKRVSDLDLVEADNGAIGLELLAKQSFNLILLDLNMPVMGGIVFLERLREIPSPPPVIVITTESAKEDVDRALALGASAYVMKPLKATDLVRAVIHVLGR